MPWESVLRYWHALGSQLSNSMKAHLMTHHKAHVREMALKNEVVTQDTFVLMSDVRNLAKK
jgi:hypothetical protein